MSLESLLALLAADVSDVSDVQANSDGASRRYGTETADVSDVSPHCAATAPDTSDTALKRQPYQREAAPPLGCTADTGDTAQKQIVPCESDEMPLSAVEAGRHYLAPVVRLHLTLEAEGGARTEAILEVPRERYDGLRVIDAFERHRMAGSTRVVAVRRQEAPDDRRHCRDCARLRSGVCTAAAAIGAAPGYRPADDVPRRCDAFREREDSE